MKSSRHPRKEREENALYDEKRFEKKRKKKLKNMPGKIRSKDWEKFLMEEDYYSDDR